MKIRTGKSLASYRECLGGFRGSIRGTFDGGDLKEVRFEFPRYGVCSDFFLESADCKERLVAQIRICEGRIHPAEDNMPRRKPWPEPKAEGTSFKSASRL
jgi:hypothetical protein